MMSRAPEVENNATVGDTQQESDAQFDMQGNNRRSEGRQNHDTGCHRNEDCRNVY